METKNMKVQEIKPGKNVRAIGDVSELAASIKQHGILQPLMVDEDNVLISGYRRLAAAKELKLDTVPVIVMLEREGIERTEVQLAENIQRQNMTPIEEAIAFKQYIDHLAKEDGVSGQYPIATTALANKIGKSERYVKNRLALVELAEPVMEALNTNKIRLGHAVLLAQMSQESQKKVLKKVLEQRYTPQELADALTFMDLNPEDLPDEVKARVQARAKKGQQSTFGSAGELITEHRISDLAAKELAQYLEGERQKLRDKGIKVFSSTAELKKEYPRFAELQSYEPEYASIVKKLPGSEGFGVLVEWQKTYDGGRLNKEVIILDNTLYQEEKQDKKEKVKKAKMTEADQEDVAKQLNLDRKQRLQAGVFDYRHRWQVEQGQKILQPGPVSGAILLHALGEIDALGPNPKVLKMTAKQQTKLLLQHAKDHLDDMTAFEVNTFATAAGVDPIKHFELTKEYLEIYTKSDLVALAKELKIELMNEDDKKPELITQILALWKKGMVPKLFLKEDRT